jgi:DNA-directed RNA polymerase
MTSKKPAALVEAEKRTVERFERREAQKTDKHGTYIRHAEGMAVCETLLPDLAEFMLSRSAPRPPDGLERITHQLAPEELALAALSPLLHEIAVGRKPRSPAMRLKLAMGRTLHDKCEMKNLLKQNRGTYKRVMKAKNKHAAVWRFREPRWTKEQCVRAGNWLLDCVLQRLPKYFALDPQDGFPDLTKEGEKFASELFAELIYRDPVFVPATEPLRDWTDANVGGYCDHSTGISTSFARGVRPATKKAIRRAFRNSSMQQHVDGVNRLQRVAWTINTAMLPVVERFAVEVGKPSKEGEKAFSTLLAQDIATAKYIGGEAFYLPMNCDFRGRVYSQSHFNFIRGNHVRALFQFASGLPIGHYDHNWIMLHVATCGDFDGIGKRSWPARIAWAEQNYGMLERTAQDPGATVDWWCNADDPFSFVAGCMELVAARETGPNYITHLPICFDGSCSGIQHLAMMTGDEVAGRLVNLIPDDEPQDVYKTITDRVIERLYKEGDEIADWWLWVGITRKLIKRPAMTFAYSVTLYGIVQQIVGAYREIHGNAEPTDAAAWYLARHIKAAAEEILPRPAAAMEFIRKLAEQCVDKGEVLEWTSPTGFPLANQYHERDVKIVHLELRGECVRHKVAEDKPSLSKTKSKNSAAPNFVHALDASHLIRVVNTAAGEGIASIAVVHDSFGCLAPQTYKLHQIIREEMARLYVEHDVLAELRKAAGSSEPLPAKGTLDPWAVRHSTYAFA